jgi:thioredoxin-like negative regulator of GroEL
MKYFIIFFIISISQTKENIEEKGKKILFPKSENIFELKQDDYEDFIKDNKYIILIFYTQWCEQCKNIMSILEQISIYCKENNDFIIARIDTDKSQDLAEKFFLSKIPSIYYIIDSNPKK